MRKNNKEEIKKTELIKKNYAWVIAITTGIGIIISAIFGFIEYITAAAYFSFYGLDINLYSYGDKGFIYSLVLSVIFMCALYSIIYCIKQIKNSFKEFKSRWKIILEDILIVLLSNMYVAFALSTNLDNQSFIINFITVFICEIVAFFVMSSQIKSANEILDFKIETINYFKRLPFLIIIFLILISLRTYLNLYISKDYKVIGNDKVIVYSNKDYYLVLNCKIKSDNIIIYKGNQTKINNLNIESKLVKFNKKEIK